MIEVTVFLMRSFWSAASGGRRPWRWRSASVRRAGPRAGVRSPSKSVVGALAGVSASVFVSVAAAQPVAEPVDDNPPEPSLDVWDAEPGDGPEFGPDIWSDTGPDGEAPGEGVEPLVVPAGSRAAAVAGPNLLPAPLFPVDPLMARGLLLDAARWDVVEDGGCRIEQAVPGVGQLRFVAPPPPAAPLQAGFIAERAWPAGTIVVLRVLPPPAVAQDLLPVVTPDPAAGPPESAANDAATSESAGEAASRPLARWSATPASATVSAPGVEPSPAPQMSSPVFQAMTETSTGSGWPPRADRRLRQVESMRGRGLVTLSAALGDALFDALLAGDDVWIGLPPAGVVRPVTDPARDADLEWAVFRGLRFAVAAASFAECRESLL